jgi:hypothetical protein
MIIGRMIQRIIRYPIIIITGKGEKTTTDDKGLIGICPNDSTAAVWSSAEDLIRIIQEDGNESNTENCKNRITNNFGLEETAWKSRR